MKALRHQKILELIAQKTIETQEDLAVELNNEGFKVTQATVSRDIKDLSLIKVAAGNNRSKYAVPGEMVPIGNRNKIKKTFLDSVTGIDSSENIIVIKTAPGTAQAVALAIDNEGFPEIIGTVAGDDTVLAVIKPKSSVPHLIQKFRSYLGTSRRKG